jgi:hypothetical protein
VALTALNILLALRLLWLAPNTLLKMPLPIPGVSL